MTQRIPMDGAEQTPRPRRDRNKKRWYMTKKEKITLITLGSVTAVLLVAAIIMISTMFASPADDGKILKGVVAAGVPLGGMTKEEATAALEEATANTYTKNDMTVEVLNEKIALTPLKTGARLDIPSVVDAAYNYGRTGSRADRERAKTDALAKSVTISVLPYLNLDTDYVRDQINVLGAKFSTTLEQGSITLTGQKPSMDVSKPDTSVVYQTLEIYVGTAEYILDTNKLYDQVLEYYNTNIFKVVGECKVMAPDSIEDELLLRHTELYTAPENAQEINGEIIPEKYGYGFDLEAVKEQIAQAPYGETITVKLTYIMPDWTEELIASGRYKDVLGEHSSTLTQDIAWNNNATLATQKLNGYVVKPGDVFSFNKVLGALIAEDGYLEALAYKGNRQTVVLGGGVTHAASVLYNCVLAAEMEILEYHNHPYAIDFIEIGRDAYVDGGEHDFRFKNNNADPIMIIAEAEDNMLSIRIEGIDSRDYSVTVDVLQEVIEPGILHHYMSTNNAGGYMEGDILFPGVNGYTANVQLTQTHKTTAQVLNESIIEKTYAPQDSIVVSLKDVPSVVPPVSNPDISEPPTSTGPQDTNPSSGPALEPSN